MYILIFALIIYLVVYYFNYKEDNNIMDNHKLPMLLSVVLSCLVYGVYYYSSVFTSKVSKQENDVNSSSSTSSDIEHQKMSTDFMV